MNAPGVLTDTAIWPAAWSLCRRELVRFVRQRSRVVAALGTPLLMWLFIGAGLHGSFRAPAAAADAGLAASAAGGAETAGGYLNYFFPGTILLVVLFTSIFSTISIIEDRHAGFLQAVLVAPVSRGAIVLGKVLGGALLGTGQGALFLLLAPVAGVHLTFVGAIAAVAAMFCVAFALTGLGFLIAWRMDSVSGFHGIMNLLLMPMWILSGAVFPATGAHAWLAALVRANPLSYGLGALQQSMSAGQFAPASPVVCAAVTVAFAAAMYVAAAATIRRTTE